MAWDQNFGHAVLNAVHAVTALTAAVSPIRVRLMTANGTATAAGTEVATGGGYTAGAGAPSTAWAAPASMSQATSGAISVTNYPRAETVNGIELWDSAGTPRRQEYGALTTPRTMAAGDTLSFAAGAITSALNNT